MILGLKLTVENDDIVDIGGDLYVKNSKAMKRLHRELRYLGYQIDNLRHDKYRLDKGATPREMEKGGWSLWFAKLPNIRRGVCGSCGATISTLGIQSHGHKCERCGEVTYWEMVEGSVIRFVFLQKEGRGMWDPELKMKVHHWDTREGLLYLYPEALEGGLSTVTGDTARQYLGNNHEKWNVVTIDGQKIIVIKYPKQWRRDTAVIEPYEIYGHQWNHKIVKIYKGKHYSDWDRLPVPETFSIYETWHWDKLVASPTLHRRVLQAVHNTDDKGWHYQDGRPWFREGSWKGMAKFIRHFTALDADAFDRAWPRFRNDGPGGIDDLAHFCHPKAITRDEPNIGNVLVAMGKRMENKSLTRDEIEAAKRGLSDPLTGDFLRSLRKR